MLFAESAHRLVSTVPIGEDTVRYMHSIRLLQETPVTCTVYGCYKKRLLRALYTVATRNAAVNA
jgi:hypothetical protein